MYRFMTRQIKFRQFIQGEWHYWGFLETGLFIGPANNTLSVNKREGSQQFTGLHDLNGKEIYEGDILQDARYKYRKPRIVKFSVNRLYSGFYFGDFLEAHIEVIGNIFSNPELLK